MLEESSDDNSIHEENPSMDEGVYIEKEKRGYNRKPTRASFTMVMEPHQVDGIGNNISQKGAYFVTCDNIPVELIIKGANGSRSVYGNIVRIDRVSESSMGVAVEFESRILDTEL